MTDTIQNAISKNLPIIRNHSIEQIYNYLNALCELTEEERKEVISNNFEKLSFVKMNKDTDLITELSKRIYTVFNVNFKLTKKQKLLLEQTQKAEIEAKNLEMQKENAILKAKLQEVMIQLKKQK